MGLSGSPSVSRTGHHISRIKSSFELFCASVRDLAHLSSNLTIFLFVVRFLGHFFSCLVTDKDYFWHQMTKFIEFLEVGWIVKKRESPDFRSPEVGISDSVEPKITRLAARKVNNTNAIGFPSAK